MTRQLRVVSAGVGLAGVGSPGDGERAADVFDALRTALAGGPAILVIPGTAYDNQTLDLPDTVAAPVALIVETSGSTGTPKRVVLTADAVLANAAASESALGGPGQWVLALPTHYIAGLNVLARSLAADTVPVAVSGSHFTAAAFVAAARELTHPDRFTSLVPAQLATLLADNTARRVLAGFRRVLVGGQATPQALVDAATAAGVTVTRSYGSSETSGGCVYDGQPIGTTVVKVVDDEIWLGGPSIAEGYLGDPALTAERFVEEDGVRWFRTADSGSWRDGMLTVTGRRDDVLISGGVKVALGAVERVLREQPEFADAVVVAAPDERWGEVPVAFTVSGADTNAAIAAVGRELGAASRPARVIRVPDLPLLASGKVDRRALAERAREQAGPPRLAD
ncbi:MAG TPA: AMP-binding protein [Pseudolysinimonas sp.]|nr:AMP-binding protein [Pseudolysinimonas sp.]